jgi:hypothetical protein
MADRLIQVKFDDAEADGGSVIGKIVNVYDTYANALAHAATGLATINAVTVLTGAKGASISQAAKTVGVTIDNNGLCQFYAADGSYSELFLMSVCGRQAGPRRVVIA